MLIIVLAILIGSIIHLFLVIGKKYHFSKFKKRLLMACMAIATIVAVYYTEVLRIDLEYYAQIKQVELVKAQKDNKDLAFIRQAQSSDDVEAKNKAEQLKVQLIERDKQLSAIYSDIQQQRQQKGIFTYKTAGVIFAILSAICLSIITHGIWRPSKSSLS